MNIIEYPYYELRILDQKWHVPFVYIRLMFSRWPTVPSFWGKDHDSIAAAQVQDNSSGLSQKSRDKKPLWSPFCSMSYMSWFWGIFMGCLWIRIPPLKILQGNLVIRFLAMVLDCWYYQITWLRDITRDAKHAACSAFSNLGIILHNSCHGVWKSQKLAFSMKKQ